MVRTFALMIAVFALALSLTAGPARAAPQILGLMATTVPQPLVCEGAQCTADLASFCLQPNRGEPWPGHSYRAVDGSDLTVIGMRPDGGKVRFDAAGHIRFAANVAMTSVRVTVDRTMLDQLGLSQAALDVGPGVSLLPEAESADADPLTATEIAAATGPARAIGSEYFEDGGPIAVVARLNTALLSQTPRSGRLSAASRLDLWQRAVTPDLQAASSREGLRRARDTFEACVATVEAGVYFSMRDCIERRHGTMMRRQNRSLRKALQTGW